MIRVTMRILWRMSSASCEGGGPSPEAVIENPAYGMEYCLRGWCGSCINRCVKAV